MNDGHAREVTCRNCGANLDPPTASFCPACGQDTLNHPPTFWEFVHEFITHYVALEGKLWKTLLLLFFKPAELTREYRAGRKLRYISPLRLYITASFLFFLVVKIAGLGNLVVINADKNVKADIVTSEYVDEKSRADIKEAVAEFKSEFSNIPTDAKADVKLDCGTTNKACQWLETRLAKKYRGRPAEDVMTELKNGMINNIPYALFLLLPLFALLTKIIYVNRGLYFGEHVVYALHVHAFTFFGLLFCALVPDMLGGAVFFAMLIYYFVAMQRFFGGRRWVTPFRYAFIGMLYPLMLSVVAALVLIGVVLS